MKQASIIVIFIVCIIGLYARPVADDYCVQAGVAELGIIGYTNHTYATWSGRWAHLLTHSTLAHLDPLIPMLLIVTLCLAWGFSFLPVIALWLASIPALEQALFWSSASITYVTPLVFAGLLMRTKSPAWAFVLAFILAGFHEGAALLIGFALCLAWVISPGRRRILGMALLGLSVSFCIVYFAEGNTVRASFYPEPNLLASFPLAMQGVSLYLSHVNFALLAVTVLVGMQTPIPCKHRFTLTALIPLAAFVWIYFACFTVAYSQAGFLVPRYEMFVSAGLFGAAYLLGALYPLKHGAIKALVVVVLISTLGHWYSVAGERAEFAARWDMRHELILAGVTDVESIGAFNDFQGAEFWVNQCAARAYGVPRIE